MEGSVLTFDLSTVGADVVLEPDGGFGVPGVGPAPGGGPTSRWALRTIHAVGAPTGPECSAFAPLF